MKLEILRVKNLEVSVNSLNVVRGCDLVVSEGELHAIMGPNGSGKSSFAQAIFSHPTYNIKSGKVMFNNKDVTDLPVYEKAKLGMFLGFQYPQAIPGLVVGTALRTALSTLHPGGEREFRTNLKNILKKNGLDESFAARSLNEGFSGGEKKRLELVQMELFKPVFAMLDEIDSGLDIDGIKMVANTLNNFRSSKNAVVVITHNPQMLNYLKPTHVHIMLNGSIVATENSSVAQNLSQFGYQKYQNKI